MHFIASLLRSRYVVWATTSDDYIYTVYVSAYGILSTSNLLIKGLYIYIYKYIYYVNIYTPIRLHIYLHALHNSFSYIKVQVHLVEGLKLATHYI